MTRHGDDGVAHWCLEIANRPSDRTLLGLRCYPNGGSSNVRSRGSRLARDFERYASTVAAFVRLAMIRIMLGRLAANASYESKLPGWALSWQDNSNFAAVEFFFA